MLIEVDKRIDLHRKKNIYIQINFAIFENPMTYLIYTKSTTSTYGEIKKQRIKEKKI